MATTRAVLFIMQICFGTATHRKWRSIVPAKDLEREKLSRAVR